MNSNDVIDSILKQARDETRLIRRGEVSKIDGSTAYINGRSMSYADHFDPALAVGDQVGFTTGPDPVILIRFA